MQHADDAAALVEAAGRVSVFGEAASEVFAPRERRGNQGPSVEAHADAAHAIDVCDTSHHAPEIEAQQPTQEQQQSLLLVQRETVKGRFVCGRAPETVEPT